MLTQEQISFFKTNGYLLVPGAMDAALCAEVRDAMWAAMPADVHVKRDDPATHAGPFAEAEASTDSVEYREGYRWLNRALGVSQAVIDLIYSPPMSCSAMAQIEGE